MEPINLRLFVDDVREAPTGWQVVRTITSAINMLANFKIDEISLDHDIYHAIPGHGELTSKFLVPCMACPENYSPVAYYIAAMPEQDRPRRVHIHTANPCGYESLKGILEGKVEIIRDVAYATEWVGAEEWKKKNPI